MTRESSRHHKGSRSRNPIHMLQVSRREAATIVASLYFHRDENVQGTAQIPDRRTRRIATCDGRIRALDYDEITALCRRLRSAARGP